MKDNVVIPIRGAGNVESAVVEAVSKTLATALEEVLLLRMLQRRRATCEPLQKVSWNE